MSLLQIFKQAIGSNTELQTKCREMILIIEPQKTASLNVPKGARLSVTGFAGVLWITVEGHRDDYRIKNGDTAKIPGGGKVVIQAMTTNIPCRLHVVYEPPPLVIH